MIQANDIGCPLHIELCDSEAASLQYSTRCEIGVENRLARSLNPHHLEGELSYTCSAFASEAVAQRERPAIPLL